jgi:high affinity Mn2+ porin
MRRFIFAIALLAAPSAYADDVPYAEDTWLPSYISLHAQSTFVEQFHPRFPAPYTGPNSLNPGNRGDETWDATLYLGIRTWDGGALYWNPELDQGFGLSGTLGVAGFPSGEAYKVGKDTPYLKTQRLFFRQTFDLGGAAQTIDDDVNQVAGTTTADNLVLTLGKFSAVDIFDTNQYAHDPRADFLNWSIVDTGAFDYAADAWGYTVGGTAEWTQDWWTLRGGFFALSTVPNSKDIDADFKQYEIDAEAEGRYKLWGHDGKLKVMAFANRGRMGSYEDAVALGLATHTTPSTASVREYRGRPGGTLNVEQGLTDDLGFFLRAGLNDGSKEAYEFTEINQTVSAGLSLKGKSWSRPDDTLGAAFVINGMSHDARDYFAHGGLGILIGDGQLPRYGSENIVEAYYSAQLTKWLATSLDFQFIDRPAYNPERGPVSVMGLRMHGAL